MHDDVVNGLIDNFIPPESIDDQWNIPGLENALSVEFGLNLPIQEWLKADRRLDEVGLRKKVVDASLAHYETRRIQMGDESANMLERHFMLQSLDRHWKEHLAAMDYLRQGIHLRGYAQKNPEQEYKREAFTLFQNMLAAIKSEVIQDLSRMHVPTAEELAELEAQQQRDAEAMRLQFQHSEVDGLTGEVSQDPELHALNQSDTRLSGSSTEANPYVGMNVGRNEPCPCGSGKKYKHCHGAIA
jgi:preprotein translocase subunit SecA